MCHRLVHAALLLAACSARPCPLQAQEDFYHPELEWKTIETEHFFVHYHEGAQRTGNTVAKIAEEVYGPVTTLYHHVPDQKVSLIINDYDDISNGGAYFFDNKIVIDAPSLDFVFRGTHNWLRDVVSHEFTHIVQIQTAMKFGRRLPSFYLQWLGYESERRPDVLYGYPNVIVSYPVSGFVVPPWFAEGVAQYNRKEFRYDFWDSHRDMILRSYVLDGRMLTWDQMGVFGKNSLGNESVYNSGFALVSYIAAKYGEDKLNEISRNLSSFSALTIDGAIERAVGKSGAEVYRDWQSEITETYKARVAPILAQIRAGEPMTFTEDDHPQVASQVPVARSAVPLARAGADHRAMQPCCRAVMETGFANLHAKYSPDGKKIAFTSTGSSDRLSGSILYVADVETGTVTRILTFPVGSDVSWSPDGNRLYYSRLSRDNPHWSMLYDVYVYDLKGQKESRLTFGKRAFSPSVSPDGTRLAFVINADGTSNLVTTKIDGTEPRQLTTYLSGEQVYNPEWSPNGDRILFDYSIKDGRDIAWVRPDGGDIQFLVSGDDDSRSGVFTPDGSHIVFSSDRTGIFNLYSYDIQSTKVEQVTNVLGGAFMPTVNSSGNIVYSAYTSAGYKLYILKNPGSVPEGDHRYLPASNNDRPASSPPLAMTSGGAGSSQFDWNALRSYDDTKVPDLSSRPYKPLFTSLTFVPFIRVDNYNSKNTALDAVKAGVYLFSNDVLDKTGIFASIALNKQFERDLFLQFAYRGKIPLLYQLGLEPVASAELYNVTRKTDNVISLPASTIPVDVTYNLLEFDFVLNQPFVSQFSEVEFRYAHSRYTSVIENFINPETNPPTLIPGSSDLYLIANDLSLTFKSNAILPSTTSDINPIGRNITLRVGRELNKFNGDGEYEVTSSGLRPVYKTVNFTRVELNWKEHLPFFWSNHSLTASLRGGSILGPEVDEFFDFYAGGLVGMKGYPFYALGGNRVAMLGLAYRFPIFSSIDLRFMQFYFDKLYASVYSDFGNAWSGEIPKPRQFKTDAGVELRLESVSFYSYPTRIFFNASYGFDRFDKFIRNQNQAVTYGREWRFYFGVLFGFDFD